MTLVDKIKPVEIVDLTEVLEKILKQRIMVLDGAWGTMLQGYQLEEED